MLFLLFNRAKLSGRMEVCPVLKHDISQLAAEVSEQVLDGNNGGMERGGELGKDREEDGGVGQQSGRWCTRTGQQPR